MDIIRKDNIRTKQTAAFITLLCKNERPGPGFKGKRPGLSPWDLHKIKTESIDLVETSDFLKSREFSLYFQLS
jgi:hypothetical protein